MKYVSTSVIKRLNSEEHPVLEKKSHKKYMWIMFQMFM